MNNETGTITDNQVYTRFGSPCELIAKSRDGHMVFVKCTYKDGTFMHRWIYPIDLRATIHTVTLMEIIKALPIKEDDR